MSNNLSGFGVVVSIVASVTFPAGIVLSQFSDDTDPIDMPSIQIADKGMGINGDMVHWSKANPLPCTLNVIPQSADDQNLAVLAEANRVGKGKNSARDIITLTAVYPNGDTVVLSQGVITDAMFGNSIASAGRLKTKPYIFAFENKTETFGAQIA